MVLKCIIIKLNNGIIIINIKLIKIYKNESELYLIIINIDNS